MSKTPFSIALSLLIGFAASPASQGGSPAPKVAITEYPVPDSHVYSNPAYIAPGPGGVWFGDFGQIWQLTPAGRFTGFAMPTNALGITAGPDGAIWFTEFPTSGQPANIGRMTTMGVVSEYALPNPASNPTSITSGPDGALWFVDSGANSIGRITTTGVISEYAIPTLASLPYGITRSDGVLWFLEQGPDQIGRITTAGVITEFPVPTPGTLASITTGPDRAVWFTEFTANQIGRIGSNGIITEYPLPPQTSPVNITSGPDGALWFTAFTNTSILRMTVHGVVSSYQSPMVPNFITTGADGKLWITGNAGGGFGYFPGMIGEIVFETANLSVSPASGQFGSLLTFAGSGFAPHETVQIYARGIGSAVVASARANAAGSISASGVTPQSRYLLSTPRYFLGLGQTSHRLAAAPFVIEPTLLLTPSSGPPGTIVTVTGYAFGSYDKVSLVWGSPQTDLGTARPDANGTFAAGQALQFTVPSAAAPGPNTITGDGAYTGAMASVWFTVE